MSVSILLNGAPGWANGGRAPTYAPRRARDFADFAAAAARRYPQVRHWMIWGEPSKASRFQPLVPATRRRLTPAQRRGPRRYARILDASYVALKRVNRRNLVIGGNTWTGGEVVPLNFIKAMRLPSGRRPRMDLYGHNPFTLRMPRLSGRPVAYGYADFSDLDSLAHWLDGHGYRDRRGRRLRLFLSELSIPTDHANFEFNFWVTRETQARWLRAALRITRAGPDLHARLPRSTTIRRVPTVGGGPRPHLLRQRAFRAPADQPISEGDSILGHGRELKLAGCAPTLPGGTVSNRRAILGSGSRSGLGVAAFAAVASGQSSDYTPAAQHHEDHRRHRGS